MKKYQCKKSLSMVLAFVVMGLCSLGVFFACQNSREEVHMMSSSVSVEYQGIDYPLPDNPIVRIDNLYIVKEGEIGWYDTQGKGDPLNVGANFYYLPRDIKNYEEYRKLLERKQEGKLNVLKFTIGKKLDSKSIGIPIIRIELPSQQEIQTVQNRYYGNESTFRSMRSLRSIMTLSKAKSFFSDFKKQSCDLILRSPCIPFQYAGDGCYARAHYMRKLMADEGYDCEKIFAVATSGVLQAQTNAGCCQVWGWHVAPLVNTSNGKYVIDPSICDGPVSISTWIGKLKSSCFGFSTPTIEQHIKPSYVYRLYNERDDNYRKTYETFDDYALMEGCDNPN